MGTKQSIEPLSSAEAAWVNNQLESAKQFVQAFSPGDAGQPLTLAGLDRAYTAWAHSEDSADSDSANAVINQVGIAFGRALVEGLGFQWVIATDEHGADLALHGLRGKGDVLVYPTNFVAKRWERQETGFLEAAYHKIEQDMNRIREQSSG